MSGTTTLTLQPNSSTLGSVATVVGAGSAHAATSDGLLTSYLRFAARARTDGEVVKLGFPAPTAIPAGAQIVSVTLKRRVQLVLPSQVRPICNHEFFCLGELIAEGIGGALQTSVLEPLHQFFQSACPVSTTGTQDWFDEEVGSWQLGPGNQPWDPAGNLAAFTYKLGQDIPGAAPLLVAEVWLEIAYQRQSTLAITAPTGTVTDTCRPTVRWTNTSLDSQPQEQSRVVVYSDAKHAAGGFSPFVTPPDQDSGWVLGESLQWTLTDDIVSGTWWAYAAAKATFDGVGDFLSNTASTSWAQSINGAPAATLTATYDPALNRVQLSMAASTGSPTTYAFQVYSSQNGAPYAKVRGGTALATGTTPVVIYDHEAPPNVPTTYKVLAYGNVSGVLVPATAYSPERTVTPVTLRAWLKDPLNSQLNTILPLGMEGDEPEQEEAMGVFKPIGRPTGSTGDVPMIVVKGVRYAQGGALKLEFWADDHGEQYWAAYQALDQTRRTLLLQLPSAQANQYIALNSKAKSDSGWKYDVIPGDPRQIFYRKRTHGYVGVSAPPVS